MHFDFTKLLPCSIYKEKISFPISQGMNPRYKVPARTQGTESLFLNFIYCVRRSSVLLTVVRVYTWACQENPTFSSLQILDYEIMCCSWCVQEDLDVPKISITVNLDNETVIEQKLIRCHVIITLTLHRTCMIGAKCAVGIRSNWSFVHIL